jgi:hypothetical protein
MYSPKNAEPSEGARVRMCWFEVGQGCEIRLAAKALLNDHRPYVQHAPAWLDVFVCVCNLQRPEAKISDRD